MEKQISLRNHLVFLLEGGGAHQDLGYVFRGIPPQSWGVRPADLPCSLWELLEHLRICQWDILEFSRSPEHESPEWPKGYWPGASAPPSEGAWEESFSRLRSELTQMVELVKDQQSDLFAPFPWGDGQTLLREALLVADHNAYHMGQVVTVRRLLGIWPPTEPTFEPSD